MLTYRTGVAGGPKAGGVMAAYLSQPTLDPTSLATARYYTQGLTPPTEADRTLAELGRRIAAGDLTHAEALAGLMADELAKPQADPAMLFGRLVASGFMTRDEALAALYSRERQASIEPDMAAERAEAALGAAYDRIERGERRLAWELDQATSQARAPGEYTSTLGVPREDTDAGLSALLKFDTWRAPTDEEQANILNLRTTTGEPVPGKRIGKEHEWTDPAGIKRQSHPTGFVDYTFSASKDLSVAWAGASAAGLHAEAALIWKAHRDAAEETMAHAAQTIGRAKRGAGGSHGAELGAITWTRFDHYTARPTIDGVNENRTVRGDMHVHSHFAIPNIVLTPEGHVGSLFLQNMNGRTKEWGATYQALAARNLRRLGVEVVLDEKKGSLRIVAIPERVSHYFSKRTNEGVSAAMKKAGEEWDALSETEKVMRRKSSVQDRKLAKQDGRNDLEAWSADAKALGYSYRSILRPDAPRLEQTREMRLDLAYETTVRLLEGELERRATIDSEDVRVASARGLIAAGIDNPKDVDLVVRAIAKRGVVQAGESTAIFWGTRIDQSGVERVKVSTELHEKWETEFVSLARAAAADRSAALSKPQLDRAIAWAETQGLRYDNEHGARQRGAVEQIGQSGRLGVMVGAAGIGKSDGVLKPLIHAWREDGRRVYGIALANRNTHDFAKAGVPFEDRPSVSTFLRRAKAGKLQLAGAVVAIDEMAQIGTRSMLDLLQLQRQHGFTIAAFGDDKQIQAIEAGPVVRLFRRALGDAAIPEISHTIRQQSPREREIVMHLREGRAADALKMMREDKTAIVVPGNYQAAAEHVAALWKARRDANAADPSFTITISVPTNRDALEVGAAVRALRVAAGEVGAHEQVIVAQGQNAFEDPYELRLAQGDRVRLFNRVNGAVDGSNTWRGQFLGDNGTVLTVAGFTEGGLRLRRDDGTEGAVKWATLRDKETGRVRLAYGYAQVINPTAGITSTEHINAAPAGTQAINAFTGYTGLTRHTMRTYLVTSAFAERQQISQGRPIGLGPPTDEDVWTNMAKNLARQPEKTSSLDLRDGAQGLRRGTVSGFQHGLHSIERRDHEGPRKRAELHHRIERQRIAHRIMPEMARRLSPSLDRLARAVPEAWEAVGRRLGHRHAHEQEGPRMKM